MKILLISPYFSPAVGGVETHLNDLCKYFEKRKHTVYVRTYQALGAKNRGLTSENSKYIKIHRLWWPDFNLVFRLEKYPIPRVIYISAGLLVDCFLFLLRNKNNIDVVQVHGFIAALWGVPLAKLFKKHVVVNTHVGFRFDDNNLMNTITTKVLKSADKVLVLTNGAKRALQSIKVPEEKIAIYHYWVDQKLFNKVSNARQKLGWDKKFTVLFVGRLVEVKGVKIILELAKKMKHINFVIAGSGPLEDELRKLSEKLNNLKILGKVEQKDLPTHYSASDLVLIPSKLIRQTYEEGIPRVMIESLSSETPVVATPSGGIPDVFDPKIGRLTKRSSTHDLEKAINFYYKNKKALEQAKKQTRAFALKHFSSKNAAIIESSLKFK